MNFETRLGLYAGANKLPEQNAHRKVLGKDGLTGAQRRRLLKKDRSQFAAEVGAESDKGTK